MSRIQFNLLPDIKLEYLRTNRTKNLVLSICIIVSVVSLTVLLLLLATVQVVQKQQMNSAQKALDEANDQLNDISDLDRIVTIQNQLKSLVTLHQNKHATERIFDYIKQVTPTKASINKLNLDLGENTMTISGNADSQKTVNIFIDTLKFTTFNLGEEASGLPAFSNVVQTTFAINQGSVSYQLDMSFDEKLFSNNLLDKDGRPQTPTLSVPTLTTTRSALDDPSNALFQRQANPPGGQQ
jgi:Tfp pilus assembly protein PilN